MKMKLVALVAAVLLGLAGCGGGANSSNTSNSTNSTNKKSAANEPGGSTTTAAKTGETVPAQAESTDEVGGTKEGCKCSAAGMSCSAKAGEKGCCGKDGECSSMVDGKSSCCASKGSEEKACCSTAGKVAMNDKNANPEQKAEQKPATTGKKS